MLRKSKAVTEKQVAANQANAKHSTGPRTERGKQVSSQNGFKHGFYAQLQPEVMAVLHEDPIEKARILTGLNKSYEPENPAQQMVVDDIFDLRWERVQMVRSRGAKMGLAVKGVERHRDYMHLQINHDVADVPQAEVLEKGLRNIADSPAKFGVLIEKLKALVEQAEKRDYSCSLPYLTAIYGKQASPRGATIFNLFLDLGRLEREREAARAARRPWPPPGDPMWEEWKDEAPKPGDPPGYDPRLDLPCEALLMYLHMELHEIQMCYSFFVEDKIMVTQMNRDAALAPTLDSLPAARALWIIDRDIDQKTRLLMKMRVEDRKWRLLKQQDQEAEESETSKPGVNGGSGGQVGPNGVRPEADSGQDAAPSPVGEETVGEDVEVSDAQGKTDPKADQTPGAAASPFLSAVGTTPVLVLMLVLHLILSLSHVTLAHEPAGRTPPQLQPYTRGPRVRALECGSAATALASVPALWAKCGRSVAALAPQPTRRGKGGSPAAALQGGLRPRTDELQSAVRTPPQQAPKRNILFRTEATNLLNTKDSASGPNPFG